MEKSDNDPQKQKVIVIPKEAAVFRLDEHGDWRNRHGRFENARIIKYFHTSIKKDTAGYYVGQINGDTEEKVYFPYEDTALFVFNVINQDLVLNTGEKIKLDPRDLFVENENLYVGLGSDKAKFVKRGLEEISKLIDYENPAITVNGRQYPLRTKPRWRLVTFIKALWKKIFNFSE